MTSEAMAVACARTVAVQVGPRAQDCDVERWSCRLGRPRPKLIGARVEKVSYAIA